MMMAPSNMLDRATEAEHAGALRALKDARDKDELVSAWFLYCDRWEGEQRVKLQSVYTRMLHKFAPMGRAG